MPVRDNDGKLPSKEDDQIKMRKEHFQKVLNRPTPEIGTELADDNEELSTNCGKISKNEIKNTVNNLKNGRASGGDNIPPKIWKTDPSTTADILYDLLNVIWEMEVIRDEWKQGLLIDIKVPKKGNLSHCGNWRGIMLLSVSSKILTRIILERLKTALDAKFRNEQAGFGSGRSRVDQIATLRIIVEQSIEWQRTLYLSSVDFTNAFDSIDREGLWRLLRHYRVPTKIEKVMTGTYNNVRAQVANNNKLSDPFEIRTGVRQGCLLSPLLILVVIDSVDPY